MSYWLTLVVLVSGSSEDGQCVPLITCLDTSCILAWLIEQGYEVYAFMADVGQEEVHKGFRLYLVEPYH